MIALDLFCGVGWDLAARELGIEPLGIDVDTDVCLTREALGMRTLQADIAALDPMDFAPCELLIASPPCPAFSMAGKGKGRAALGVFATAMQHMRAGASVDRDWLDAQCEDETAYLVLEPLRWALSLEPEHIACEQVTPVLPLWNLMADVLRERGYSCWAGVLEAERYGVPQTRERAILMASRVGVVHPPMPTHQRYVHGESARHEHTLEGEILPWVSMREALAGIGDWPEIPAPTVTAGGGASGGPAPFGRGASSHRAFRLARGAGMTERYGERRDTLDTEPAPVIGPKVRTATWEADSEPSRAEPSRAEPDLHQRQPAERGHATRDRSRADDRLRARGQ